MGIAYSSAVLILSICALICLIIGPIQVPIKNTSVIFVNGFILISFAFLLSNFKKMNIGLICVYAVAEIGLCIINSLLFLNQPSFSFPILIWHSFYSCILLIPVTLYSQECIWLDYIKGYSIIMSIFYVISIMMETLMNMSPYFYLFFVGISIVLMITSIVLYFRYWNEGIGISGLLLLITFFTWSVIIKTCRDAKYIKYAYVFLYSAMVIFIYCFLFSSCEKSDCEDLYHPLLVWLGIGFVICYIMALCDFQIVRTITLWILGIAGVLIVLLALWNFIICIIDC